MLAFAQDGLDTSIRSAEEAESLSLTPALGVIPFERISSLKARRLIGADKASIMALALTKRPRSSMSEAFRALGTAISVPHNSPKTVLVTSGEDGVGKTVSAVNLWQVLSHLRGPALIMDCDLRKGGVAEALGIRNDRGVSSVLLGKYPLPDVLHQYGSQQDLWILPSGPLAANPAELLASPKMQALLNEVTARFSCVIIDSPPVLAVTDATILAPMADAVLLVAASGGTPRSGLIRTQKLLTRSGAKILGLVVNKVDPRFQSYQAYGYHNSKPRLKKQSLSAG
jgi:polysaccharide biosynthesis transport protein